MDKKITKVITYGTFDLFHQGHYRLLQRAKQLGDYLIVELLRKVTIRQEVSLA